MYATFCWTSMGIPGEKTQVPRSSTFIWMSLSLWVPKAKSGDKPWGWECMLYASRENTSKVGKQVRMEQKGK